MSDSTTRPNSLSIGQISARRPSHTTVKNTKTERVTPSLLSSGKPFIISPTSPDYLRHNHVYLPIIKNEILTPPNSSSKFPRQTTFQPLSGPITPTETSFLHLVESWTDEHVAKWLHDIRLPHLSPIFSEHDILGNVLLDVDHTALKEMGIWKVGERVKIMVAIKSLRKRCLRDRRQHAFQHATTSVHFNMNKPKHPTALFHSPANCNWNSDYASSSSNITSKLHKSDSASKLKSRPSSIKRIPPPPLRLKKERIEGLPRVDQGSEAIDYSSSSELHPHLLPNRASARPDYQAPISLSPTDYYNQNPKDRVPTDPGKVIPRIHIPPLKRDRAGSFSNFNSKLHRQGAVWDINFFGLAKTPSMPGKISKEKKSVTLNSDPAPPETVSSEITTPLCVQNNENPNFPGSGGFKTTEAVAVPASPVASASGSGGKSFETLPLIGSGTSSNQGQAGSCSSSFLENIPPIHRLRRSASSRQSRKPTFRMGLGPFKRPATATPIDNSPNAISMCTGGTLLVLKPTTDEMNENKIKVTLNETGITVNVNIEHLKSLDEFMSRVNQELSQDSGDFQKKIPGKDLNPEEWIIRRMPEEGMDMVDQDSIQPLNEQELLDICKSAEIPERQRGLMLKQIFILQRPMSQRSRGNSFSSTPDSNKELLKAVQVPRKIRHRASAGSIMSGLMMDPLQNSEPRSSEFQNSLGVHPDRPGERVLSFFSPGMGKFRNFFGHRPPSELISNHLVDYFPRLKNKKNLSNLTRSSVQKPLAGKRSRAFSSVLNRPSTIGQPKKLAWNVAHFSDELTNFPTLSSGTASPGFRGEVLVPRISMAESKVQKPLEKTPAPSPQNSPDKRRFPAGGQPEPTDRDRVVFHPGRKSLEFGGDFEGGERRSRRKSDNASILTVDEVTAEVAHRKMKMNGEVAAVMKKKGQRGNSAGVAERASKPFVRRYEDESLDQGDDKAGSGGWNDDYQHEEDGDEEDVEEGGEGKGNHTDPQKMTSSGSKASIKWVRGALIGTGSFGRVYLGMHALKGTLMAVKQVERPRGTSHNEERKTTMLSALVREIEFLKELQHQNIVQYLDSSEDDSYFNIFLEYVPGGSVSALLKNYGPFEEALVKTFTRQILDGLNYLHSKDIIHRDIKGANILVDNKAVIKISDFGISKRVANDLLSSVQVHRPSLQGSVFWMAPEVVKQTSYTRKADIWSLGCLIVEMLTGEHPWVNLTQMQAIFRIGSFATPEIPDDITDDCLHLLKQTFLIDHLARPTANQLLNHAFFNSKDFPPNEIPTSEETATKSSFEPGTIIKDSGPD